MFKSIRLKNLFSHEDSTLDLSPGVNVIRGRSNDGKSAIRRAVCWVADNRPLGDGMIRYYKISGEKHLTKKAEAEIVRIVGDKTITVIRSKGKGNNGDYVITDGESKIELNSFGQAPPNEVAEAVNLNEINVQKQFSPYFLAFDPPGQVATFIRSITKLDEIDIVSNSIAGQLRNVQQEIETNKSELCTINAQIGELERSNFELLEKLINDAELVIEDNRKLQTKIDRLSDIVCDIDDLSKKSITLPINTDTLLKDIVILTNRYNKSIDEYDNLKSIIESIKSIVDINIDSEKVNGIIKRKFEILETYNKCKADYESLFSIEGKLVSIDTLCGVTEGELIAAEKSKIEIEGQLVNCPKCGTKLTEMSKQHLLSH